MKKSSTHLRWPARHLPECREAGRFPMDVPSCNHSYTHRTIAAHLHDYVGTVWLAGKSIRLQPGDITLTPPHVESRYKLTTGGTHLCVHFVPAARYPGKLRLPLHFRPGVHLAAARERFWRILDYARLAEGNLLSPYGAAASAALQEFLLWVHLRSLSRRNAPSSSRADEVLARLREIIDRSLARECSVPDLAREAGFSADYLSRLFRRRHGMGILPYLLLRRMELARHLLRSTTLPIGEICRQAGIRDPQYFNKQFRRVVGVSPSHYRWHSLNGGGAV